MDMAVIEADRWIFERIKSDSVLIAMIGGSAFPRVFVDVVPKASALPAVVFQMRGQGTYVKVINSRDLWWQGQYQIKAITRAENYSVLIPIADRLTALFEWVKNPYGPVISCVRNTPFRYPEFDGETQYRHLGLVIDLQVKGV